MRWQVNAKGEMLGSYSEEELRELVRKGLRDALVRPEGGDWAHITKSPFGSMIAPAPKGVPLWLFAAVVIATGVLLWFFTRVL
jgi:hypothetical protein